MTVDHTLCQELVLICLNGYIDHVLQVTTRARWESKRGDDAQHEQLLHASDHATHRRQGIHAWPSLIRHWMMVPASPACPEQAQDSGCVLCRSGEGPLAAR
jgi:hypothetical protein